MVAVVVVVVVAVAAVAVVLALVCVPRLCAVLVSVSLWCCLCRRCRSCCIVLV